MAAELNEKKIVDFVKARRDAAEEGSHRKAFMSNFDVYKRAYKGEFKNKLPDHYSQFFVPLTFQTVDTVLAYFYESLFSNYPLAVFSGRFSDDQIKGKSMQHVMDYEIYKRNFIGRVLYALQWVLKYGTCVTYDYWRYQTTVKTVDEFVEMAPGMRVRQQKSIPYRIYDNPSFEIIDPRFTWFDPNASSIEAENGLTVQCKYGMHEKMVDFSDLVTSQRGYMNLDKVYKNCLETIGNSNTELVNTNNESVTDPYRKRVKVTTYWGPVDLRYAGGDTSTYVPDKYDASIYHIEIANDKEVIFFKKNYYYHNELPYQVGNIYKSDDSLYGMSLIETVLSCQDIMNALMNMRLDNIHDLVRPQMVVWRGGLEDKDHFKNPKPGPIYVRFPEDLSRIVAHTTPPDVGNNAYQQMFSQMELLAMKSSAANPMNMGVPFKTTRSATEIAQVTDASTGRFKKMSFVFSNSWMQPTLQQFVQLIQQYTTSARLGSIMGQSEEAFVQYSPEEIQGEYDVEVMDATVTNKELVFQAHVNLLAAMAPYVQSGDLDKVPILRGILDNMPLIKNADEIIKKTLSLNEQEVAAIQQMAPGVVEAIVAQRQAAQGVGQPAQTTPGSGFNGGASNAGGVQPEMEGTGVKMAI